MELYFEEIGSGPPLVLLHGLGANRKFWDPIAPYLKENFCLVNIDLKGFGDSPKPSDQHYSIFDEASLVSDFILQKQLRDLTLVGHSWGGGVALAALCTSEEVRLRTRSMILIDSIGYRQVPPYYVNLLRIPLVNRLVLSYMPSRWQARLVLRKAFYDPGKITSDRISVYSKPLESNEARKALQQAVRGLFRPELEAITSNYPQLNIPVQLVWGRQDDIVPLAIGERLSQDLPAARLEVIEECGHAPPEEKSAETAAVMLRFLEEIYR